EKIEIPTAQNELESSTISSKNYSDNIEAAKSSTSTETVVKVDEQEPRDTSVGGANENTRSETQPEHEKEILALPMITELYQIPFDVPRPCSFSVSTIVGARGKGGQYDQLDYPFDIFGTKTCHDIYVADSCNSLILKLSGLKVCAIAGGESPGSAANQLNFPMAMFVDEKRKQVFVSDFEYDRIQKFSLSNMNGHGQTVIGQNGEGDGLDQFNRCYGLFVDKEGQWIYLSDYRNHRVTKWKNVEDGNHSESVLVAGGHGQGSSSNQLNYPRDICVDESENNIYICDYFNHRVQRWSLDDLEAGGVTVVGGHGEGFGLDQLSYPMSITLDSSNKALYVADSGNNRIIKLSVLPSLKQAVSEIILGTSLGQGPSHLFLPRKLFVDNYSNQLYIVGTGNHRLQKFIITGSASTSSGGKDCFKFETV
ncbi:unnamed protein product, partial [Didymodactylos carnosus]